MRNFTWKLFGALCLAAIVIGGLYSTFQAQGLSDRKIVYVADEARRLDLYKRQDKRIGVTEDSTLLTAVELRHLREDMIAFGIVQAAGLESQHKMALAVQKILDKLNGD